MKKALLLLVLNLLALTTVHAQDDVYEEPSRRRNRSNEGHTILPLGKTRFGVFFAPNISWMKATAGKSDDRNYFVESKGSRSGYTWGLMIDQFFSENYGISTGLHINTTGGRIVTTYNTAITPTGSSYVTFADFSYRLQYIEIPLNLKLISDEFTGGLRVFGNLGASLGLNIGKKATYEVQYEQEVINGYAKMSASGDNEKLTGTFAIAPAVLQLNIGAGVEYPITDKLSMYGGLFFNNGFAPDVTNPSNYKMGYNGKFSDGGIRVNNFALRIGLFF